MSIKFRDMPLIKKYYKFTDRLMSNELVLLSTKNDNKILSHSSYKKGEIFVFSISLSKECGNFALHPVFIPTLYNIALFSQIESNISYIIGEDLSIDIKNQLGENNDH